jgi:hypothetical protein
VLEPATADATDTESLEPDGTWLALYLNLYRPSVFGIEAAREIAAVAEATDSDVLDPQDDEPEARPFDADKFLRQWNHANVQGHRAFLTPRDGKEPMAWPRTLPGQLLHDVWVWNDLRERWSDELGEEVFVPRVMLIDAGERVETAVVWTDCLPIMLPRVDRVLVYRDALRRRNWLGMKSEPDLSEVSWADLAVHLPAAVNGRSVPYHDMRKPTNIDALRKLITSRAALPAPPKGVALDQVHDRELLPELS